MGAAFLGTALLGAVTPTSGTAARTRALMGRALMALQMPDLDGDGLGRRGLDLFTGGSLLGERSLLRGRILVGRSDRFGGGRIRGLIRDRRLGGRLVGHRALGRGDRFRLGRRGLRGLHGLGRQGRGDSVLLGRRGVDRSIGGSLGRCGLARLFGRLRRDRGGIRRDHDLGGLGRGGGEQRHGDGRPRPGLGDVAERLQDRGEILARAADQRGHPYRGDEAFPVGRAGRRRAGRGAGTIGHGRADQVGETLQDVDPHRPLAADAEAGRTVEALGDLGIHLDRGAARARQMRDLVEAALVEAAVAQSPELGRQRARGRLEQSGQEDVVGAEAHAVAAQRAAAVLVEAAHLVGDLRALQHAECLDHLVADALGEAGEVGRSLDLHDGPEEAHDMRLEPGFEARLDLLAGGAGEILVGQQPQLGGEQLVAGHQFGHRRAGPADHALVREDEGGVGRRGEALGPRLDLRPERLLGGASERLGLLALGIGIRHEQEAVQVTDVLTLDGDVTVGGDLGFQHRVLSQAPHQDAGAPVHEAAREAFVQGVGQPVLYPTRLALPMFGVAQPVRTIRDECPGAPLRDAPRQGVDVAVGAVDHRHMLGEPCVGDASGQPPHQEAVELGDEIGMHLRVHLAVIRHAADIPETAHRGRPAGEVADVVLLHQDLERLLILAHGRAGEPRLVRMLVEARLQGLQRIEDEIGIAPLQDAHRVEIVALQALDQLLLEGRAAARGAEGAVRQVAAGPAGDLAHLGRGQLAEARAVVLPVRREGDVIDVEIEPHPDRVGGDEVIHVARLIELDLRVPGAGREGAEHHRRAAALAPDQLGDGIDLLGREGDDGRAARQPRELLLAGEAQGRESRPRGGVDARDQRLHQRLHGARADQQSLLAAALIEQPVGEDVAAIHVGTELDLVDGDEGHVEIARHRLDGADPVARPVGLDLLLAGDEGDRVGTHLGEHAQVDLAGQQPQRQPDHAGRVLQHPLDGEMRLAGIGGAEHRRDAACAGLRGKGAAGHQGRARSLRQAPISEGAGRRAAAPLRTVPSELLTPGAGRVARGAGTDPHMGRSPRRRHCRIPFRGPERRRCPPARRGAGRRDRRRAYRERPQAARGAALALRPPGPKNRRCHRRQSPP
ncbi:hypothetical protein MET9862_01274 [Methylobacterium symbioticum]|uniref:Uncharacterized protein n=1 Tax=Methylobacterium symbioticum TaxID=2584084 RepID=A0A509E934_9HYPH|nr:hypothetical protein MET9862_01274 [Methylobacterium symbioticum]